MRIVITEFMENGAVDWLRDRFDVLYDPSLVMEPERLASLMGDVDGLIVRNRTQVRGAVLDNAARLKAVGRLGVGLDNLDLEGLERKGIPYFPATGANALSVVEYTLTAAMMLLRGAYLANAAMLAGRFPKTDLLGRESAGKVIGLVGFGAIARDVARKAEALGFRAIAYDPFLPPDHPAWGHAESVSLQNLAEKADVVSLHVPLTAETETLVDADFLDAMKTDAVLINTSRGEVVDEEALAAALRDGRIGGAALDVFRTEPLTEEAAAKFAGIDNLILTPHIAGNTIESNIRVSRMIAEAVAGALGRS